MSRVDQRVVEMRFDNKHFEKNIKATLASLGKLKSSLDLGKTATDFNSALAGTKKETNAISASIQTVTARFSAMQVAGTTALVRITNAAITAGMNITKALTITPVSTGFNEYETQINSIQTILSNTKKEGATLGTVNKALDELNEYSDKTIYNFTEMTRNIGTFTAAGVKLDTSVQAIKGIANLAAISGSTSMQASTAMYQLSQALASGTVRLMDWNSLVNAGMGGKVFQDALTETARVQGIEIDALIAKYGSFRETLQDGWLSAELMTDTLKKFTGDLSREQILQMGYTEQQAQEILELGRDAADAATKVKTFTQLFDTLKEAAQSGWAQSWRFVVGDFEQARETLTAISDEIGGIIGQFSDARNKVLMDGLASSWDQFIGQGVGNEEIYKTAIENMINADEDMSRRYTEMLEQQMSWDEILKTGFVNADMMKFGVDDLTKSLANMSDEQLKSFGYTRQQYNEMAKLNEEIQNGSIDVEDYAARLTENSGRENLIQSFKNIYNAFNAWIAPIGNAWKAVFDPFTGGQLYSITEALKNFTAKLTPPKEIANLLYVSFKGLFSILNALKILVGGTLSFAFDRIVPILNIVAGTIVYISGVVSQGILVFSEWTREMMLLERAQAYLIGGLQSLAGVVAAVVVSIKDLPSMGEYINGVANSLKNVFNYLKGGIDNVNMDGFMNVMGGLFESLAGIGSVFKNITTTVGKSLSSVATHILTVFRTVFGFISENFNTLVVIGLSVAMFTVARNLTNALSIISKGISSISGVVGAFEKGIKRVSRGIELNLMSLAIRNMAISIAILTASLYALVRLTYDVEKMLIALGMLAGVAVILGGLAWALSKLESVDDSLLKVTAMVLSFAASVFIMAKAIDLLYTVGEKESDPERLSGAIAGIVVLMGSLLAMVIIMDKAKFQLKTSALSLLSFAAAILLLSTSLDKFAQIDMNAVANLAILGLVFATLVRIAGVGSLSGVVSLIAMAVAIKIVSESLITFLTVNTSDLIVSIDNMESFVVKVLVLFGILALAGKQIAQAGVAIAGIAASLLIVTYVIEKIANMEGNIDTGFAVVSALLSLFAVIIGVSTFAGEHAAKAGVAILAMSVAMVVLSGVVFVLSLIPEKDLKKATECVSTIIAVMSILVASTYLAKEAAKTITAVTVALGFVLSAVVILSLLKPEQIMPAVAAVSVITIMLSLLVASAKYATGSAKTVLSLMAVVVGLGAVIYAMGQLESDKIVYAVGGLVVAMAAFAAFAFVMSHIDFDSISSSALGMLKLIGIIALFGAAAWVAGKGAQELAIALDMLVDVVSKLVGNAWDGVKTFISDGYNAIKGFVGGFSSGEKEAYDAGVNAGDAVSKGVTDSLDIHSPSRVLYGYGQDGGVGLATGMHDSIPLLTVAGNDAGTALKDGVSAGVGNQTDVGKMAGEQMVMGMQAKTPEVKAEAQLMGAAIKEGIEEGMRSGSPQLYPTVEAPKSTWTGQHAKLNGVMLPNATLGIGINEYNEQLNNDKTLLDKTKDMFGNAVDTVKDKGSAAAEEFNSMLEKYKLSITEDLGLSSVDELFGAGLTNDYGSSGGSSGMGYLDEQMTQEEIKHQEIIAHIEEEKHYKRMGLLEELALHKQIQNLYLEGTEERKAADREVFRLENELNDAYIAHIKEIETLETSYSENHKQRLQERADEEARINDQLKADIQSVKDEYNSALDSRTDSLMNTTGLFDIPAAKRSVSAEAATEALEKQVAQLEEYTAKIAELEARGVNGELLEQFREMGPEGMGEMSSLLGMTDDQLTAYTDLYAQKHELAKNQATNELEDLRIESLEKIEELERDARRELNHYNAMWNEETERLKLELVEKMTELQTEWGLKTGEIAYNTTQDFQEMTTNVKTLVTNAGWDNLGNQVVEGFALGIDENTFKAEAQAAAMAKAAILAAEKELEIKSPSRVTWRIGEFFIQGFVNSVKALTGNASNATAHMARVSKLAFESTLDTIGGDITQPVITPVLDLTPLSDKLEVLRQTMNDYTVDVVQRVNGNITDTRENQNDPTIVNVKNEFNQTNNSPKNLSAIDIYRRTKTLFVASKGKV